MDQNIDPMKVNVNWDEFRETQRGRRVEAVRSALALDEVARREHITVVDEEVEAEVERFAERRGRTAAAVRARSRRKAELHAFTRDCGARKRSISCSRGPQRSRRIGR
jgi:FKBP-type peptidyl-prolyl cis-trans isomerase (trigger factor)